MFAQTGKCRAHEDPRYGAKSYEVYDADATVSSGDVGVEAKPWPEERRPVLSGQQRDRADEQGGGEDHDARIFAPAGHGLHLALRCRALRSSETFRVAGRAPPTLIRTRARGCSGRPRAPVPLELTACSVDMAVEDLGDLTDFKAELCEFFGKNGLDSVGEGFLGFMMYFNE